jgi:hypothetical protein
MIADFEQLGRGSGEVAAYRFDTTDSIHEDAHELLGATQDGDFLLP